MAKSSARLASTTAYQYLLGKVSTLSADGKVIGAKYQYLLGKVSTLCGCRKKLPHGVMYQYLLGKVSTLHQLTMENLHK